MRGQIPMKKSWKKAVGVLCAGMLMLTALTGCGGEKKAADTNEIKVGGNFELTGGVASFGKSTFNGFKMAIDEVNAAGGVNGKKINFIYTDNKSEISEASNATTKLITKDKVSVVVGPVVSASVLASAQIATDNKVPLLTPTGTNEKITFDNGKLREYLFRSCFIDPLQGEVMANFAAKSLNAKKIAVYLDSSSDYSKGLAQVFTETTKKLGGQIISQEAFLQKDTDFKATLTKIKAQNPEVIFIPAYYQEVGMIVKQARELGMNMPIIGVDGWDSPRLAEIAGADALNNTYFCNHYSPEDKDPRIQKFVADYKKIYNQAPDALAALGYDAGLMLVDALKRANSTDPKAIRDALAKTKDLQVVTGKLSLDAKHNPVKGVVIIEMKNGLQTFKERINL